MVTAVVLWWSSSWYFFLLRRMHLQPMATVGQAIVHATSGLHPNRDPPLLWNDQRISWYMSIFHTNTESTFHRFCNLDKREKRFHFITDDCRKLKILELNVVVSIQNFIKFRCPKNQIIFLLWHYSRKKIYDKKQWKCFQK